MQETVESVIYPFFDCIFFIKYNPTQVNVNAESESSLLGVFVKVRSILFLFIAPTSSLSKGFSPPVQSVYIRGMERRHFQQPEYRGVGRIRLWHRTYEVHKSKPELSVCSKGPDYSRVERQCSTYIRSSR